MSSSSIMATTITTTKASQVVLHRTPSITATLTLRRKDLPAKKRYGYFSRPYESNFDDLLHPRRGFFQRTWHRITSSLRSSFDACLCTISTSFQPLLTVFCTNVPMDN